MGIVLARISKISVASSFLFAFAAENSFASNGIETSLLKSDQVFRPNFSAQPNLDKGEVVLPVKVSVIYVVEQSLPDFLSQLASRNSVNLTLSENVSGVLKKISFPMKLELILPALSKSYGLEWHMQGKNLFVSSILENVNRLINLGDMEFYKLREELNAIGLNQGANRMSFLKDKNAITLIGSSRYISKVEAIVRSYQSTAKSN